MVEVPTSPPAAAETRCGFVAVIGAPNVGKSTLVNALVGGKVTIVSPKVQTTRTLVRGIAVEGAAQLIFVDTPGLFAPRRRLERAMVTTAWSGAKDADLAVLVIDAKRGLDADTTAILDRLAGLALPKALAHDDFGSSRSEVLNVIDSSKLERDAGGRPVPTFRHPALVLNKVDLVAKPALLDLAGAANARIAFAATFMISALNGDGVADLKAWLAGAVPAGPWLYPEDQMSDAPLRSLAAEITREKLFLRLHQELPYRSTVETEVWTEQPDGAVRIEQTIYVERESQRKIVLGKGGRTIKAIGSDARKEIAELIGQRVHLFLFVKVREGWADDPERYREMGLEFPRE